MTEAFAYDLDALRNAVEKMRENIKVFEKAIEDERDKIIEYEKLISEGEIILKYHTDGMPK